MIEEFRMNKITENKILEEINMNQRKLEISCDKIFEEKVSDDEEIKLLIRQEKSKIASKSLVVAANIKIEL